MKDLAKARAALPDTPDPERRRMLMRLGLAATAIYAAPVLTGLAQARASSASGSSGGSGSGPSGGRRRSARSRASGRKGSSCSASGGSCGGHGKARRPIRRLFGSGPS